MNIKENELRWCDLYRYNRNIGVPGCVVVEPVDKPSRKEAVRVGSELNHLSRFIWGMGAAANSVYNAHGFFVKFQGPPEKNEKRAKILTKAWRELKKKGYDPLYLPRRKRMKDASEKFIQRSLDNDDLDDILEFAEEVLENKKTYIK